MQNVQNAAEIQQRVINLVELYRTKVGKESQIAKDAKAFYDDWQALNDKEISRGGDIFLYQYQDLENPNEQVWIEHLMVNEQLLGHFYSVVAGEDTEKDVLDQLLPEVYDKTILSKEEETFLANHFKEMVNYIILTPCDEDLKWVNRHDGRDALTIPNEVLELIGSRVKIPSGSKVYYPYAGFAQLTNLFKGCKFLFQNKNAWMQVAIYANAIDADFYGEEVMPASYDAIVSFLPKDSDNSKAITRMCEAYKNLSKGGDLVLFLPSDFLVENRNPSYKKTLSLALKKKEDPSIRTKLEEEKSAEDIKSQFMRMLIDDNAIKEIIQLPSVMSENAHSSYCIVFAKKDRKEDTVTFIDASSAQKESDKKNYKMTFDIDAFNAIIQNGGIDESAGLRKLTSVPYSKIDKRILSPYVYVIERPTEDEHPVPLSSICQLVKERIRDVKFDLSLDTPYILHKHLSSTFKGALDVSKLDKIGFPNNPSNMKVHDITDEEVIPYVLFHGNEVTYQEQRIALYRSAIYLSGKKDAVLWLTDGDNVKSALYQSSGKDAAVGAKLFGMDLIYAFHPNPDIDALSLLAILNMPIVYRQMMVYAGFGLDNHLDDILVPTNKRIIGDEVKRLSLEQEAYSAQEEELAAKKTEYVNEVRMRKHDMGQKVFDLINTEDLIRYYVENRETESDLWPQIEEQLDHFRKTVHELSEMLDHLSQEEQFGIPEIIDLKEHLMNIQHSENVSGFKVSFSVDKESLLKRDESRLRQLGKNSNIEGVEKKDKETIKNDIDIEFEMFRHDVDKFNREQEQGIMNSTMNKALQVPANVMIAKNDLHRIISNIIANAKTHGFTDTSRKDYKINIILGFDEQKKMFRIDFRNNGTPLPEGMNKVRYGIKGEKAGITAGTGLGGSVIKSIVEHYKGDYDVFMDGEWTVVRVYLPIAL